MIRKDMLWSLLRQEISANRLTLRLPSRTRPLISSMLRIWRKWVKGKKVHKIVLAGMDTGFIAQNVYLYCASEGLPTGYRVSIDRPTLSQTMKL